MLDDSAAAAPSALDQRIRVATIVVAAIASSVVFFGAIGTVLARQGGTANATLTLGIVSAASFALVGSVLYRRFNYQPIRLRQVFRASGATGLADHLLRTTIVSSALSEAVAVFGLLMGILTGDTYYLYALCAIALLGVLSNFPRAKRWRELSTEIAAQSDAGAATSSFGVGGAG
jgi:hypothetical protein